MRTWDELVDRDGELQQDKPGSPKGTQSPASATEGVESPPTPLGTLEKEHSWDR